MKSVAGLTVLLALCVTPAVGRALWPARHETPLLTCADPVELRDTNSRVVCADEASRMLGISARAGERYRRLDGKIVSAPMSGARTLALALPLDVNRATPEDLEALPGIGPKRAAAIFAERPFADAADLMRARGIGEKRATALAPLCKFPVRRD